MTSSGPAVLVLNAGSSSLKFAVFTRGRVVARGQIERIGRGPRAHVNGLSEFDGPVEAANHGEALEWVLTTVREARPEVVAHRVVHGGTQFCSPVIVTAAVLDELRTLIPLAPLHQPHNLGPIEFLLGRRPDLLQVACFDTAFHASNDRVERMFALPRAYYDRGVMRYGFHGLSYESIAGQLPTVSPRAAAGRTVVCHLGNGASLCALVGCRSVATTMGFTALEGLVMGTRCGSIDPGVILYLLQHDGMSPAEVSDLLYQRSGLLGVSGIGSDMRDLTASDRLEAKDAVELFCRRAARAVAAMASAAEGLDAIVFTAGIGEHSAAVRASICEKSAWLGVRLDPYANVAHKQAIHSADSQVEVLVVPTDEEAVMAEHARRLTAG